MVTNARNEVWAFIRIHKNSEAWDKKGKGWIILGRS